jgi:TonB family protein
MISLHKAFLLCGALATLACGPMPPMPYSMAPPSSAETSYDGPPHRASSSPARLWPTATSVPLGNARVPFARYVIDVHARLHPYFADGFLASLDRLPATDPRNDRSLFTEVAFVVEGKSGHLHSVEVYGSSGVPAFDGAVLDAVKHAFPSAPADRSLWSNDGNVYATWEFHRCEEACGAWNARPLKLEFQPAVEQQGSLR